MRHTLESSRAFGIIAWIVIIVFSAVTWILTVHLKQEFATIEARTEDSMLYFENAQTQKIIQAPATQ